MSEASRQIADIIRELEHHIPQGTADLPKELFLFVSRITPLVNVDLLVQDAGRRTLLTWRSDEFYGPGWHIPGGIIRLKERAADRIRLVAQKELGATVQFEQAPILIHESIEGRRRDRGHFISLLYRCDLTSEPDDRCRYSTGMPSAGQWMWHDHCPDNLIPEQRAYAAFMR